MFWIILCVLALVQASSPLGSLSLYHYSGTTFLNLRHPSRQFSFEIGYSSIFETNVTIDAKILEISREMLKPKDIFRNGIEIEYCGGVIDKVVFSPGRIRVDSLQRGPNGHRSHQSWIVNEQDYLSKDVEDGDVPIIHEWISRLEKIPILQTHLNVDVSVPYNSYLLRNLMINFYRDENRKYMMFDYLVTPKGKYQDGCVERLMDIENDVYTYNPSMDQLYDDFVIRQLAANITGSDSVWKRDLNELRALIINHEFSVLPEYGLDITSVLLAYRPDDLVSKKLSGIMKNSQTVRFNELHGKIDVAIKRAVGFVKVTEMYGPIVADAAIAQVCHVNLDVIPKIRSSILKSKQIIFKYIVRDPETCPEMHKETNIKLAKWYEKKGVILGYIESGFYGVSPLVIPGDSIVWHQRTEHRFNILGKFNPALINFNLAHLLENKWFENLYWEYYCKGRFLPKTQLLWNMLPEGTSHLNVDPVLAQKMMKKFFPKGYVVKGVWDYASMDHIISHNSDIPAMSRAYTNSSFDKIVERKQKHLLGCEAVEDLKHAIRHYKLFKSWKVDLLLKDATETLVQAFQDIQREFRVECAGGICPEWRMGDDNVRGVNDTVARKDYYKKKMNQHFMKCIDGLPQQLKGTPLTSDLALTRDNKVIVFETNPGGNSWFIHNSKDMSGPHNEYLRNYTTYFHAGPERVHAGMSPTEQIIYIRRMLDMWKTPIEKYAPRFRLMSDRIINSLVYPKGVVAKMMNYTGGQVIVEKKATKDQMETAIQRSLLFLQNNMNELIERRGQLFHVAKTLATFQMRRDGFKQSHHKKLDKLITDFTVLETKFRPTHVNNHIDASESNILQIAEYLRNLDVLGIEHQDISEKFQGSFDQFVMNTRTSWEKNGTNLFNFELMNDEKFNISFDQMLAKKTRGKSLKFWNTWLTGCLNTIRLSDALEKINVDFPVKSETLIKFWFHRLRKIYRIFFRDNETMKTDEKNRVCFVKLVNLVAFIVRIRSCDGSVTFHGYDTEPEYIFTKRALKIAEIANSNLAVSQLIDSIYFLGVQRDITFRHMIPKINFFMVYRQKKNGAWLADGEETDDDDEEDTLDDINLENTVSAVTTFLKHKKQFKTFLSKGTESAVHPFISPNLSLLSKFLPEN